MKTISSILFCLLFTVASSMAVPLNTQQEIIARINKAASGLKSMSCNFTQTKHLSLLSDKMTAQGEMHYTQPGKLRWEYTSPYQYIFIFNDTKVYVGNKSRKEIIDTQNNKIFKEVARIMMATVTGTALSNSSEFDINLSDGHTAWKVTLIPKKKEIKKMFAKTELFFSKPNLVITEINIYEKNNDRTHIKLKNVSINTTVNETLFAIPK